MDESSKTGPALPEWTVIGFTGHRNLSDSKLVAEALDSALDRLQRGLGSLAVASSAASGADTIFLEAARRKGLPSFLVLPFPKERFRLDFDDGDWRRVEPLIQSACRVEQVLDKDNGQDSYMEAGLWTVDMADIVLAAWDGKPAAGRGGTADVVAYAKSIGKPLISIDPATGIVSGDFPVTVPSVKQAPAPGEIQPAVHAVFESSDQQAGREAPKSRKLLLWIIVLHLLATAIALVPPAFGVHNWMSPAALAFEIILLMVALWLAYRHKHSHHTWIARRGRAEICRSALATWSICSPAIRPVQGVVHPYMRNLWLGWHIAKPELANLETSKRLYKEERIRGQAAYFSRERDRARRHLRWMKSGAQAATLTALLAAVLGLAMALTHASDIAYGSFKLISLVLPLVNAGLLSLVLGNDLSRRSERYQQLGGLLDTLAKRITVVPTRPGLDRLVGETESLLLAEVLEWEALSRVVGDQH